MASGKLAGVAAKLMKSNNAISTCLGEMKLKKRVPNRLQNGLPFAIVCDKMNLLQAAYLLKHAVGIVGVDTGLLHLANALEKPVVGIYTDTDPIKTGVQVSPIAKNLGNIGQIPTADLVYQMLMDCVAVDKG